MKAGDFDRTPLIPGRLRRVDGSFAFLPHRLLREGYWASLEHHEQLLYVVLALVADRQGMSFYHDDRLASILRIVLDRFLEARAGLVRKDLLAYEPKGPRYQLLSLPPQPYLVAPPSAQRAEPSVLSRHGPPPHIRELLKNIFEPQGPRDP